MIVLAITLTSWLHSLTVLTSLPYLSWLMNLNYFYCHSNVIMILSWGLVVVAAAVVAAAVVAAVVLVVRFHRKVVMKRLSWGVSTSKLSNVLALMHQDLVEAGGKCVVVMMMKKLTMHLWARGLAVRHSYKA